MKKFFLMLMFVVLTPACVLATTSSVTYDNSTPFYTTALTGYATTGAMMDGMTVTAWNDLTEVGTATWADTGTYTGAASNSGFSLSTDGDTFGSVWSFSTTQTITSIQIDAGAGDTVFDVISTSTASPGSANGKPFDLIDASNYTDVSAIYSGPVSVATTFYGDLYRYLTLDLTNADIPDMSSDFSFRADTDNLSIAGDINPSPPVPEPTTILLFSCGLVGLAFYRRKRQ